MVKLFIQITNLSFKFMNLFREMIILVFSYRIYLRFSEP